MALDPARWSVVFYAAVIPRDHHYQVTSPLELQDMGGTRIRIPSVIQSGEEPGEIERHVHDQLQRLMDRSEALDLEDNVGQSMTMPDERVRHDPARPRPVMTLHDVWKD